MVFQTFEQFESWLAKKGLFHHDLSLGRISRALAQLCPGGLSCQVAQVLGTNGKGSTSAFIASLVQAHGLKAGLYTSPHFVSARERIQINGRQPEDQIWLAAASEIASFAPELTYFETMTLLAAMLFCASGVDIAVLEAGMGGWHDATTAIPAGLRCYTAIGMDHEAVIGPGLAGIALDKAMAIQPGDNVLSVPQYPGCAAILKKRCEETGSKLEFVEPLPDVSGLGLAGSYQAANAGLALAAWRRLSSTIGCGSGQESQGLAEAFLPGRMQSVSHGEMRLILDGGHNPHAIAALLASLKEKPDLIVYSALADKNWRDCLAMLLRLERPVNVVQLCNSRAASAWGMAAWAGNIAPGLACARDTIAEALAGPPGGTVLVCGSLYLLAEIYTLYPQYLQKDQQWRNH